jgi:hypothetical protein
MKMLVQNEAQIKENAALIKALAVAQRDTDKKLDAFTNPLSPQKFLDYFASRRTFATGDPGSVAPARPRPPHGRRRYVNIESARH